MLDQAAKPQLLASRPEVAIHLKRGKTRRAVASDRRLQQICEGALVT
jgi:hypothetical protein